MTVRSPEVILFDFFGTLVRYEQSWTDLEYGRTHGLLGEWGSPLSYERFMAEWDAAYQACEAHSVATHEEHAGSQVVDGFLQRTGIELDSSQRADLLASYLDEWCSGVWPVDGVQALIEQLAGSYRLGVVSNTHNANLVHDLIVRCEIPDVFDVTVLSIDHGYRKPHPSIYSATLDHFGCSPAEAVFVGDSLEPDYLGPRRAGIPALLIDPDRRHSEVADEHRIDSVLDLPARLGSA